MSLQHVRDKLVRQASRTRRVPDGLKFWLDLIQDIHPERELPQWADVYFPPGSESWPLEDRKRAWEEFLRTLPPQARRYVRSDREGTNYPLLRAALDLLRKIARSGGRLSRIETRYYPLEVAALEVDPEGKIRLVPSPLAESLQGVEAARIRECKNEKCKRIFWAGRKDQWCCSQRCGRVERTRKWRGWYQERYKQNRIRKGSK